LKKEKKVNTAKIEKTKHAKVVKQKPKKEKKKKTLKQNLFMWFTVFFVVALFVFTLGTIFTANDFSMTLIFSQDTEKTTNVIEKVRQDLFAAPYVDMLVSFEMRNSETGQVSSSTNLDIKYVHYANTNTFEYTAVTTMSTAPNLTIETFYKNATLYTKASNETQILDKSKSNIASAQQTLSTYYPIFDASILKAIFPTDSNALVNDMYLLNQKSTFIFPFNPLYIGQQIKITYQENKREIFKLNYKGEPKQRSYILGMGLDETVIKIDYRTTNKIFHLSFPADLDTY
jgi:hypothetical protein